MDQGGSVPAARTLARALLVLALASGGASAQDGQSAALGANTAATHMYKAGNFKKAAELYHTAFKIEAKPAFLFNAARSEQRVMMLDAAEKHFKQVLALKDVDARTRSRTKLHLQEIATVRKALAAAQTRASPPEKPEAERTAKPANPAPSAPSPQAATARTGDGGWKAPAGWA